LSQANLKDAKVNDADFQSAQLNEVLWGKTTLSVMTIYRAEEQNMQRPLPATDFLTDHPPQSVPTPSSPMTLATSSSTLQQTRADSSAPTLELCLPAVVDWLALAGALRQMAQATPALQLNIESIDRQPEGKIMLRFSFGSAIATESLQAEIKQRYEQLSITLNHTFRGAPNQNGKVQLPLESNMLNQPINQLLELLMINLL
jgi:hypothetical protein